MPKRWFPSAFLDLKLARWLGRKVFMTLQGCDVRNSKQNSARNEITMCHLNHCQLAPSCRSVYDGQRRRFAARILPYCHRVFVLNPDLVNDVPGATFLPYAATDVESIEPVWPRTDGPIRLLHAPTSESIKGTPFILAAIERLKARWPIELSLVRNLPHAAAMQLYARADLVIDQLLAGWYGGFAVEVMALGKPVASYIRDTDLARIPAAMRTDLPVRRLSLPTLEADLELLLQRRNEWPEWARRGRSFVLQWHNPRRIADAMLRAYKDSNSTFDLATTQPQRLRGIAAQESFNVSGPVGQDIHCVMQ